jgi:hypothetical protein
MGLANVNRKFRSTSFSSSRKPRATWPMSCTAWAAADNLRTSGTA